MAEILPTPDPGPVAAVASVSTGNLPKIIECSCCGCHLGRDGGIVKTGERAKKLARIEDKFDTMQAEIDDLRGRLERSQGRLHEVETELQRGERDKSANDDRY